MMMVAMCGIVGVWNSRNTEKILTEGLLKLQHRGYDAWGMITFDPEPHIQKSPGAFHPETAKQFPGNCGIAQLRYTTQGSHNSEVAQPLYRPDFSVATAHNGNITNTEALKKELTRFNFQTENDLEPLLYTFLDQKSGTITPEMIFNGVQQVHQRVAGGYAVVLLFPGHGMLGFVDPAGIRPLFLATEDDGGYIFASESYPLNEYSELKQLQPGEAIWVTAEGIQQKIVTKQSGGFCLFESIYFSHPESTIFGEKMIDIRRKMGQLLGKQLQQQNIQPDIVIDIPRTARYVAEGVAAQLKIPHLPGITKRRSAGRTFILPEQTIREEAVAAKFKIDPGIVRGKIIALIDDSIVRGTTARYIIQQLREHGAQKIYLGSGAPPIQHPCYYGIDIAPGDDLIARNRTTERIATDLGADGIIYQDLNELQQLLSPHPHCIHCFSGIKPVKN